MSKEFSISSILDCNTRDEVEIRTNSNGDTEKVTINHLKEDGTREKITDKEEVWKFLKEKGINDAEIAALYGNMVHYKVAPYPGTDTIDIENAIISEMEHWPSSSDKEYFKHRLYIGTYDMLFAYTINDKRILLDYCKMKDVRLGFWIDMNWKTTSPFKFVTNKDIPIQNLLFGSWKDYFSVEAIKEYVIEHGAHKNFLTEEGIFY